MFPVGMNSFADRVSWLLTLRGKHFVNKAANITI
jgi:hypothetical protein